VLEIWDLAKELVGRGFIPRLRLSERGFGGEAPNAHVIAK